MSGLSSEDLMDQRRRGHGAWWIEAQLSVSEIIDAANEGEQISFSVFRVSVMFAEPDVLENQERRAIFDAYKFTVTKVTDVCVMSERRMLTCLVSANRVDDASEWYTDSFRLVLTWTHSAEECKGQLFPTR